VRGEFGEPESQRVASRGAAPLSFDTEIDSGFAAFATFQWRLASDCREVKSTAVGDDEAVIDEVTRVGR
jgi:hypothetical protein